MPDVSQRHLDAALRFLSTGYLVGSEEDYASLRRFVSFSFVSAISLSGYFIIDRYQLNRCFIRILVEYFGIGGVPATLAEEGDGFEVGDLQ